MKEITPEIKRRIFALYYGQNVVKYYPSFGTPYLAMAGDIMSDNQIMKSELELTPLHKITKVDAVRVAHRLGYKATEEGADRMYYIGLQAVTAFNSNNFTENILVSIEIVDFLRSRGYALPYLNWDVKELIKAGVFKLKS